MSASSIADAGEPAVSRSAAHGPQRSWSRTVAVDLVGFADVTTIVAAALLPAWIFASYGKPPLDWAIIMQSALVAAFVGYLCLRDAGMYDASRMHDFPVSPARLAGALSIAIICVIGLGLPVSHLDGRTLVWYVSWLSFGFVGLLATRWMAASLLARMTAAGRFDRRIAIFGAGPLAGRVQQHLGRSKGIGARFAGLYDDRAVSERIETEGLDLSGNLNDLLAAAQREQIDDIIIALPQQASDRIACIARTLEQVPCNVHVVSHIASDLVSGISAHRVSQIGGIGLVDVKSKPLADWSPIVKRAEDIVIGGLALLVALPVLIIAIIAIKLETPGPALYVQRRRGLNRSVISVLKLRTLSVTEDDSQVKQVTQGDSRVTRVGRILRRTSIDELPQLWNVLRGDMSIVGPRPHALVHDDQFSLMLEDYANRHQVKPGITGLAQVNGLRGQTETIDKIKARVDSDIAYIRSWSLWLDLRIVAQTAFLVISGHNAH